MTLDTRLHQAIRTIILVLLGLMLLSTGCISKVALTKQVRESIRSISINKNVKISDDMYYYGEEDRVGMTFGVIGAVVAQAAAKRSKAQIKVAMQENQIDLGQIIQEQLATELLEASVFPLIVSEGGDAELRLDIRLFGFSLWPGTSELKPMLAILGSLVRTDGTVSWQQSDYVTNLNEQTPSHTLKEYLENPEFIREAFTVAAKIVNNGLVKKMRRG